MSKFEEGRSQLKKQTPRRFKDSLVVKIMLLVSSIILLSSALLGTISYYTAKKNLIEAGKENMKTIVLSAKSMISELDQEVQEGKLTLEEAQERARIAIVGPVITPGEPNRDFSKSAFLYKKQGYMFAYDSRGILQMSTTLPVGKEMLESKDDNGLLLTQEYIKRSKMPNPEDRYVNYNWKNSGEQHARDKIAYVDYYENWDWVLVVGAYYDEFYEPLVQLKYVIAVCCILFVGAGIFLFYLLSKSRIKLLKNMQAVTTKISNGDLTVRPLDIKGSDELFTVASSVNNMARNLKILIGKMNETGNNVASFTNELSTSIDEYANISNEMTKSISEVASSADRQYLSSQESSNAVQEITIDIQRISETTTAVSEITKTTANSASEGNESIKLAALQMNKIRDVVHESSAVIQRLGERSEQIGEILSIISSISAQTNLLSLNAAIEAARAGEHGKGFSVVAAEVRKLAEQTTLSAKNIDELIKEIQDDASQSIHTMAGVTKEVNEGIYAVNKAGDTFKEIVNGAQKGAEEMISVSAAIEKMAAGSEEVFASLTEMTNLSSEATRSSQQLDTSSKEQLATMQELQAVSKSLQEMTLELEEMIFKFKI